MNEQDSDKKDFEEVEKSYKAPRLILLEYASETNNSYSAGSDGNGTPGS